MKRKSIPDWQISLRQLADWYRQSVPGRIRQRQEQELLDEILPNLFGYHLVQLGMPFDEDLLSASRISHRIVFGGGHSAGEEPVQLVGRPEVLPFATDSLDVIILPYTLEFCADPHQVLREVDRVLIAEGHAIFFATNPFGIWLPWRWFQRWRRLAPWNAHCLVRWRLCDWLSLLGYDVTLSRYYFHRPPVNHDRVMDKLQIIERIGRRFWPVLAGSYVVVARKRITTLTPIRPRWRPKRKMVSGLVSNRISEES